MSIIHEALKKAERERTPQPSSLPRHRGMRTVRRRVRWKMAIGILIGVATVAVSTGTLLWWPGTVLTARLQIPSQQRSPATVPAIDAQPVRRAVAIQPVAAAKPFEPPPRAMSDPEPSAAAPSIREPAPVLVSPEAQAVAETAFEQARDAESKGQWEDARQHYLQALTLNPSLVEAHNNLGNLYIRLQQLTAAIDEFRAAIALDPHYALVRNNLGSAYLLVGEERLAIQEFMAALHIDGAYVSPYYNLAALHARRGEVGQAIAFLTKALALEPAVLSWLQADPEFDAIKDTPEFQRLRAQGYDRR